MKIKDNLRSLTINQLMVLTGQSYRKIKEFVGVIEPLESDEGVGICYDPREALPLIYQVNQEHHEGPKYDPAHEKARLDKLRGDKVQLELEVMRGNLLEREIIDALWTDLVTAFRSKILTMPSKLAPQLAPVNNARDIESMIRKECSEALDELSKYAGPDENSVAH